MDLLLQYYLFKRIFLFFDEWMFYALMIYCFWKKLWIPLAVSLLFGVCAIYTSYKNLESLEKNIHDHCGLQFDQEMLYIFDKIRF